MQRVVSLAAFAGKKTDNGIMIKEMGLVELKLSENLRSHTRGTIMIDGKILPIVSSDQTPKLPQREINENSCILLIGGDCQYAAFKLGVLVNNTSEITEVAHEFI